MRYFSAILYLVLLGLSANALAQSVFVNDQLRVGVRLEPSQLVAPVGVVLTGMKLQVLERKDPFIKIRTKKGLEGWIKDIYVTDKTPAILRVKDLESQQKKAQQELQDVVKTKAALEEANLILNDRIDTLKAQRAEFQRNQAIQIISSAKPSNGLSIIWLIAGALVGFLLGYLWHRHQSMKRLGGLRI
ncbi:hypothetical protein MNBD_GAMMA23-607 [hydrothermal vent metagenome]|uniref:SH3b domain-containing protein n=1 Tax=hydrothermal vent metagenome TaxID=652676 RepID=A0A3B0ZVX5_9ZZZZ